MNQPSSIPPGSPPTALQLKRLLASGDLDAFHQAACWARFPERGAALVEAAILGIPAGAELLLPLVHPVSHWANRAMQEAASGGHVGVMRVLLAHYDPEEDDGEAMKDAASTGQAEAVKVLLTVPQPQRCLDAALARAVDANQVEIARLLLAHASAKTNDGRLFLQAAERGYVELLRELLKEVPVKVALSTRAFQYSPNTNMRDVLSCFAKVVSEADYEFLSFLAEGYGVSVPELDSRALSDALSQAGLADRDKMRL